VVDYGRGETRLAWVRRPTEILRYRGSHAKVANCPDATKFLGTREVYVFGIAKLGGTSP
jgi:hypothetical protein